ncbi:hypothetical protein CVT26_004275 [Gymnopilus dilepis]|uniref:Uncharacterized protein n=1 Tax=Gymnopilus dilepis TaxID=231916 RepID=A0A409WPR9_9AGAR|nr:hypothetical protein CVT26_004275 [Gymnopilus dilepis]
MGRSILRLEAPVPPVPQTPQPAPANEASKDEDKEMDDADGFESWTDVLAAMHSEVAGAQLKCPTEGCTFSANTEEAVALHCVGLKSNRPCKDKAFYRELLYDHADESDDDEDVWSVFSGKVERALEFKAEMLKAFAPFRRLSPYTYNRLKEYTNTIVERCVVEDLDGPAATRISLRELEAAAGFTYEDLANELRM